MHNPAPLGQWRCFLIYTYVYTINELRTVNAYLPQGPLVFKGGQCTYMDLLNGPLTSIYFHQEKKKKKQNILQLNEYFFLFCSVPYIKRGSKCIVLLSINFLHDNYALSFYSNVQVKLSRLKTSILKTEWRYAVSRSLSRCRPI